MSEEPTPTLDEKPQLSRQETQYHPLVWDKLRNTYDYFSSIYRGLGEDSSSIQITESIEARRSGDEVLLFSTTEKQEESKRTVSIKRVEKRSYGDSIPSGKSAFVIDLGEKLPELEFEENKITGQVNIVVVRMPTRKDGRRSQYHIDKDGQITPPKKAKEINHKLNLTLKRLSEEGLDVVPDDRQKGIDRREFVKLGGVAAVSSAVTAIATKDIVEGRSVEQSLDREKERLRAAGLGEFIAFHARSREFKEKYGMVLFPEITDIIQKVANGNLGPEHTKVRKLSRGWSERSDMIGHEAKKVAENIPIYASSSAEERQIREGFKRLAKIFPGLWIAPPERIELKDGGINESVFSIDRISIPIVGEIGRVVHREAIRMFPPPGFDSPEIKDWYNTLIHELQHTLDAARLNPEILEELKPYMKKGDVADYLKTYIESTDRILSDWARMEKGQRLDLVILHGLPEDETEWWDKTHKFIRELDLDENEIRQELIDAGLEDGSQRYVGNWYNYVAQTYLKRLIDSYASDPKLHSELLDKKFDSLREYTIWETGHYLVGPS